MTDYGLGLLIPLTAGDATSYELEMLVRQGESLSLDERDYVVTVGQWFARTSSEEDRSRFLRTARTLLAAQGEQVYLYGFLMLLCNGKYEYDTDSFSWELTHELCECRYLHGAIEAMHEWAGEKNEHFSYRPSVVAKALADALSMPKPQP